ncbi:protein-glutamate O-methyltransferase CheR [Bacillus sp. ISL-47]|uniref:CheR family methyltransferase n=1 Tax=Bacillus sp. ISL-47 TaxID=2819130 RepID=UPI001BE89EA1|nr:protein-glutamate O-methyltransferase CheR [Bacillus sp. ISL-47]MBT2690014.1 protein-glutamate O-methyltransferase CheR [Bacillus sp. ISL-47]MBT2707808.1 protein-glutamate O-methyltransferase CheR [Pseudomonas sp. ISL-84]
MERDYQEFIINIKRKTGIDLSLYKEAQMKRRLTSLYEKKGFKTFEDFYSGMNRDRELLNEFLDRMTINVSEFYRNAKRWEVMEKNILPGILKQNKAPRIWSAACSTGEEPYTIAMILSKFLPLSQIKVTATDIDENALARARMGIYPERSLNEVPEPMKQRFFRREGSFYKISDDIKKTVMFKKQNLLADNFGGPYDLIVCRNVLIYFTEEAKDGLYHKFSSALKKDGIFFVGSTEQIFNPGRYHFESAETFFYRKL